MVAGIVVLAAVIAVILADALHLGRSGSSILMFAMFIPAGVMTWYLGKWMNRGSIRQLVDPQTGQTVTLRNDHSFFFVPVQWWGVLIVVVSIFCGRARARSIKALTAPAQRGYTPVPL